MLTSRHADVVAERFGLGPAHDLVGPVARGRLGEIWRLTSTTGQYAVKESRTAFDPVECERDAAYQDLVRATGVPMPAVVRTVAGEVVGDCDGQTVRVYEWVDVEPENRRLEPAAVGSVIAKIHAAGSRLRSRSTRGRPRRSGATAGETCSTGCGQQGLRSPSGSPRSCRRCSRSSR